MSNGIVKFFNAAKGFGFITSEEGKDVFVAASAATSAGLSRLETGQKLTFDTVPDGKGPKAINLVLISNPDPPKIDLSEPKVHPVHYVVRPIILYVDPADDQSAGIPTALQAAGYQPRIVDYVSSPPNREELKRLSLLLGRTNQSIVRRYDPLFSALRLDDRFISENEYWDAVVEHPSLINGPIVVTSAAVRVCRSNDSLRALLAELSGSFSEEMPSKPLPKRLSELVANDSNATMEDSLLDRESHTLTWQTAEGRSMAKKSDGIMTSIENVLGFGTAKVEKKKPAQKKKPARKKVKAVKSVAAKSKAIKSSKKATKKIPKKAKRAAKR